MRRLVLLCCLALASIDHAGCATTKPSADGSIGLPTEPAALGPIVAAQLEASRVVPIDGRFALAGARNETLGFAVKLERSTLPAAGVVRMTDLRRLESRTDRIPAASADVGQIVDVPVDLDRAGYVRQNGATPVAARSLPRAVLPLPAGVALSALRPETNGSTLFWVDLAIPTATPPGEYVGSVEIAEATKPAVARLPIHVTVYDLVLPDSRALTVVGTASWDSLNRHFTDAFEAITPKLMNRTDSRYKKPVAVLDALVTLAQRHRLTLIVDRLQPSVKWNPFSVDWTDFDSLVGPWLDGTAFADREPLGLWPLPTIDFLFNYPATARREYYSSAASHFDAREWLPRAPVWIDPAVGGETDATRRRALELASNVLDADTRVRVAVPMAADQLQFADAGTLPKQADDARLLVASPGLIFNTPLQPLGPRTAPTFLRTDLAGLIPFAGTGGDERDVRVWAWLAYIRNASILRFDDVLPSAARPDVAADPNDLTWFYPGRWFGTDGIVPSIQLKWLRRAEQDAEYLKLASGRGGQIDIDAHLIAQLLTKPVQIQAAQRVDPTYALMAGTAEPKVWDDALRILTQTILLRGPGQATVDEQAANAVGLQLLQWAEPLEKPLLLGRTTQFEPAGDGTVRVRLGLDVYNASSTTPRGNTLGFARAPRGWTISPEPQAVPPLATYQVARFGLAATVDPDAFDPRQRGRVTVDFTNGFTRRATPAPLSVPVAVTRKREGNLAINGSLDDWSDDDAISLSPLVRMIDRPTLQAHEATDAATPSNVYSAWSDTSFYVAFKVGGLSSNAAEGGQNYPRYDFRRAWGEDLVEVLVQAVYADGNAGPVLHLIAKRNGSVWSERKLDLREGIEGGWEPLDSGVRYACPAPDKGEWYGEMAIPWRAIHPPNYVEGPGRLPVLLRFNFVQHQHATGTSASWAGRSTTGGTTRSRGRWCCGAGAIKSKGRRMATWHDMARDNRTAAFEMFSRGRWRSATSRAYYAVYAETTFTLLAAGVLMPAARGNPSHAALPTLIGNHLYTIGVSSRWRLAGIVKKLYSLRLAADYIPDIEIDETEARLALGLITEAFELLKGPT